MSVAFDPSRANPFAAPDADAMHVRPGPGLSITFATTRRWVLAVAMCVATATVLLAVGEAMLGLAAWYRFPDALARLATAGLLYVGAVGMSGMGLWRLWLLTAGLDAYVAVPTSRRLDEVATLYGHTFQFVATTALPVLACHVAVVAVLLAG